MPNIRSAKKKQRQDITRTKRNAVYEQSIKKTVKGLSKTSKKTMAQAVKKAYSLIDKAAKRKVIHKNKAAKLKSQVSKLASHAK